MNIFKNILEKLKVTFSWSGNTKKTLKAEKSLQLSQEENGVMNVTNITQNITVENLQTLAEPINPQAQLKSAGNRFLSEQALKHENWSNAVRGAELEKIKEPRDLSKDWYLRWSEIAEKTSKDDLQDILSKILAGEIKRPDTFSYRTLDFVKNFTTEELRLFKKIAVLSAENRIYISKKNLNDGFFDFSYDQIMKLIELGFLQHSITTVVKLGDIKKDSLIRIAFRYFSAALFISNDDKKDLNLPIISLTDIGIDIANLLEIDNEDKDNIRFNRYLDELIKLFKTKGLVLKQNDIDKK